MCLVSSTSLVSFTKLSFEHQSLCSQLGADKCVHAHVSTSLGVWSESESILGRLFFMMIPAAFLSTCVHLVCFPVYTLGGGAATKESNLGLQIQTCMRLSLVKPKVNSPLCCLVSVVAQISWSPISVDAPGLFGGQHSGRAHSLDQQRL